MKSSAWCYDNGCAICFIRFRYENGKCWLCYIVNNLCLPHIIIILCFIPAPTFGTGCRPIIQGNHFLLGINCRVYKGDKTKKKNSFFHLAKFVSEKLFYNSSLNQNYLMDVLQ